MRTRRLPVPPRCQRERENVLLLPPSNEKLQTRGQVELPEDEVEADHSLRLRGPAVVEDGGLGLGPNITSVLSQEAVVARAHLAFGEHCMQTYKFERNCINNLFTA